MTLINILLWIILGGIAGWIASIIMGRDAQMGAMANIIVGIVGALLGGFLVSLLGIEGANFNDAISIWNLVVAVLGAVVLLFLLRLIRRA